MVIFINMGKKVIIPEEQVKEIINLYVNEKVGTPTLSTLFGYHKTIINRTLKDNGVDLDKPGRRDLGGKKVSDSKYYKKNKEIILLRCSEWSKDKREHLREYHKEWREKNRDKINKNSVEWGKNRRKNDPSYKIHINIKTALYSSLKERDLTKHSKTFDILGYSLIDLITHLENQFVYGMTWENYGEWHIDHILPISKFNIKEVGDLEFNHCWSLSNLRPLWSTDNLSKGNKIIAHQFKIRQNKQKEELNKLSFNINDISLKNSIVRPITRLECEKMINEYEWLGYLPKYSKYHFGLFFNVNGEEYLGGVVSYQPEYGDNMNVWDNYGFTGKIIQLSRGTCTWWSPKNSASFMISKTIKWLEKNTEYEVISSTVDPNAGEIGTIYQSMGWYYVGLMSGNITSTGKERIRYSYRINEKIYNQRHIRKMIGTAKREEVIKHFPDVVIYNSGRKRRYFKFIKNETKHLPMIIDQLKPYPKR